MAALVRFYKKAVQNAFQSKLNGRPVFDEVDYAEIRFPGQDKDIADRAVKPEDKEDYEKQWARYQRGLEQVQDGTPLESWPQLSPGELAMLKSQNIHTIEVLADLNDGQTQNIMGAYDLRRRAKAYLEQLAPVSRSAALLSDATALAESAEKLSQAANETGISTEDQAQSAVTLSSVVTEQAANVKMALEHVTEHYDGEIARLTKTKEGLITDLGGAVEHLSDAGKEIEGKMKLWRIERGKVSEARGETPEPALAAPEPEPDPNKPEIVGSAGSDPTESEAFFESAQA